MELRLIASQIGLGIPKTELGFDLVAGTYIGVRHGGAEHTYGMASILSPVRHGQLLVAQVDTQWFPVEHGDARASTLMQMGSRLCELELDGIVAGFGAIDIALTVFSSGSEPNMSIRKVNEPARGFMASGLAVRDTLRLVSTRPIAQHYAFRAP